MVIMKVSWNYHHHHHCHHHYHYHHHCDTDNHVPIWTDFLNLFIYIQPLVCVDISFKAYVFYLSSSSPIYTQTQMNTSHICYMWVSRTTQLVNDYFRMIILFKYRNLSYAFYYYQGLFFILLCLIKTGTKKHREKERELKGASCHYFWMTFSIWLNFLITLIALTCLLN